MAKKRVSDLAKEIGKSSRELVKTLRDLGFEQVKSAQSALDDADLLQIQARLEAYGLLSTPQQAPEAAAPKASPPAPLETPEPEAAEEPLVEVPIEAEPLEELPAEPEPLAEELPAMEAEPPLDPVPAEAQDAPAEPAAAEGLEAAAQAPEAPMAEPKPARPEAPPVVRSLRPKRKGATILGHIQLPQDMRADAAQRSRPLSEIEAERARKAERSLQQRALQDMRSRAARPTVGGRAEPFPPAAPPRGRGGKAPAGPAGRPYGGTRRQGGSITKLPMRGKSSFKPASTLDPSKPVVVSMPVSVKDLSQALGIKVSDLLRVLMLDLKVKAQINSFLEQHVVELVADALDRKVVFKAEKNTEEVLLDEFDTVESKPENLRPRPPIVTILGHVDHGKTSLLDRIREANVAAGEAGGITQHIGAYRVTTKRGHQIVVIDTPGHEAFTQMRARGAQVTDIAILVVAADDGVMPTTEEAIAHVTAAKVPIVVALNKIDKPDANAMRAMQQLATKGLSPEEWGGTIGMVPTSAVTGQGIEDLVERVVLEAEVLDLMADPSLPARGTVLEAKQTPEEGTVVTFLVQNGTLRKGDNVLCGLAMGRVRLIKDDMGGALEEAGPGLPVQVVGLPELPEAGAKFYAVSDLKKGREVAEKRTAQEREKRIAGKVTISLGGISEQIANRERDRLNVVLKVDVKGSLEPLRNSIADLKHEEVGVEILHAGVGAVTEADVDLAEVSKAIIIAFNTPADELARAKAEDRGVQILYFDVIYDVIDQVRAAVEGRLKPLEKEVHLGTAEVRQIFRFQKHSIAGCYILDGQAQRNAKVRLLRGGKQLFQGRLASLRREKDDAREVKSGFECGIMLDGFDDIQAGDKLDFFEVQFEKRTL